MKLDFNRKVPDLTGEESNTTAVKALIDVFNFGSTNDPTYHDKKKDWATELKKDGTLSDIDKTDAKKLMEWVLAAPGIFDFVKIFLRSYIQDRIDVTWPKENEKDEDTAAKPNRKTRRLNKE